MGGKRKKMRWERRGGRGRHTYRREVDLRLAGVGNRSPAGRPSFSGGRGRSPAGLPFVRGPAEERRSSSGMTGVDS